MAETIGAAHACLLRIRVRPRSAVASSVWALSADTDDAGVGLGKVNGDRTTEGTGRLLLDCVGESFEYFLEQLSRGRKVEAHESLAGFAEGRAVAERNLGVFEEIRVGPAR